MEIKYSTDEAQKFVDAMYHEFTLCEQAFDEFFILAGVNINGKNDYELL